MSDDKRQNKSPTLPADVSASAQKTRNKVNKRKAAAAFLLAYRTQVPIVPMFAIVEGLNILKCAVGYLMVRRRRWVVNLVGRQA